MASGMKLIRPADEDNSLRVFTERYKHSLPVIIEVTSGYQGLYPLLHEFAVDDVYMICGLKEQNRLLMKDDAGRYISIPMDHPTKFQLLETQHESDGKIVTLSYLYNHYNELEEEHDKVIVMAENNSPVKLCVGLDHNVDKPLGRMRVIDVYSDIYLVAHSILPARDIHGTSKSCEPTLYPTPISIPVYMDVRVAVITRSGFMPLDKLLSKLNPPSPDWTNITVNKMVMLLPGDIIGGEYEYIKPCWMNDGSDDTPQTVKKSTQQPAESSKIPRRPRPSIPQNVKAGATGPLNVTPNPAVRRNVNTKQTPVLESKPGSYPVTKSPADCTKFDKRDRPLPPLPPPRKESMKRSENVASKPGIETNLDHSNSFKPTPCQVEGRSRSENANESHHIARKHFKDIKQTEDTNVKTSVPVIQKFKMPVANVKPMSRPGPKPALPPRSQENPIYPCKSTEEEESSRSKCDDEILKKQTFNIADQKSENTAMPQESVKTHTKKRIGSAIQQIPQDISQMSVDDVVSCIEQLGLDKHALEFSVRGVDGFLLCQLTKEAFMNMGLEEFDVIKLMAFINGWRPKMHTLPLLNKE